MPEELLSPSPLYVLAHCGSFTLHRLRLCNPQTHSSSPGRLPQYTFDYSIPVNWSCAHQQWTACEPCRTSLGHARQSLLPHHLPLTSILIGLPTRSPGLRRSSPGRDPPVRRIIAGWMVPGRSGPNRCRCCISSHTALTVLPPKSCFSPYIRAHHLCPDREPPLPRGKIGHIQF